MDYLMIGNDEQEIIETNYFDSSLARQNYCFLSANAGAFRLLLPAKQHDHLAALGGAAQLYVLQGRCAEQVMLQIICLADDPELCWQLTLGRGLYDRQLPAADSGRELPFTVWIKSDIDQPVCAVRRTCTFKIVSQLLALE